MAKIHRDVCRVEVAGAEVPADGDGAPVRFRWAGRSYRVVEVLASWVEAGPWWGARVSAAGVPQGARPIERQVWRVVAGSCFQSEVTGIYDLVHESGSGRWWLTRVWD
ncbi:MAG: hypothetical protein QG597_5309 [Actinomycetota bacterium]|nr:hypothetical protein [Actinomycetota bacterium]